MCAYNIQNPGDRFHGMGKKTRPLYFRNKIFSLSSCSILGVCGRRDPQSANENEIAAGQDYGGIQFSIKLPGFRRSILIVFFSSEDATMGIIRHVTGIFQKGVF